MKIFVSLLIILISVNRAGACGFKPDVKKVISLSGSMIVLLDKTNLLKSPVVKGISVFGPVNGKNFSGKIYPGGLFIAQSTLSEFSDALVFFDKSEQLKKILSSRNDIKKVEFSTRGKLPLEVVDDSIKNLSAYVYNCEKTFEEFRAKTLEMQNKLLKKISSNPHVVFYLGPIKGNRVPEMVVVNDGVVALLLKEKKIRSYPTELSYVNWSAKVMAELPSETLHVGLDDPAMKMVKEIKRSSNRMTLIYPGVLVPGYTQLEAFLYWAETIF